MNGQITKQHNIFPAVKDDFHYQLHDAIDIFGIDAMIDAIDYNPGAIMAQISMLTIRIPKLMPPKWFKRAVAHYSKRNETSKYIADLLGYSIYHVCYTKRKLNQKEI